LKEIVDLGEKEPTEEQKTKLADTVATIEKKLDQAVDAFLPRDLR